MQKRSLALLALLGLAACAGSKEPIAKQYFVLGIEEKPADRQTALSGPGLALTSLKLAGYLEEPGIAMILEGNQINIARHSLWGEDLRVTVPRLLVSDLESACICPVSRSKNSDPASDTDIDVAVRIDRFGPSDKGMVMLSGESTLSKPGAMGLRTSFYFEEDLTEDGYPAAVHSMRSLLRELAQSIVSETAKLQEQDL